MRSGAVLICLAVSIGALVAGAAEDAEPTDPRAGANDPLQRRRQVLDPRTRQPFAGVELTADQQRRLKELTEARASWRAEYEDELNALRQQISAARVAGDTAAFDAARDRIRRLQGDAPNARDMLDELTPEQRAQFKRNRGWRARRSFGDESDSDRERRMERQKARFEERRRQRFAGVGLSKDQQRRIEELGPARRAWHEQHKEQLRALREQQRAAAAKGDAKAEAQARKQLEELRATRPEINEVLSELTDQQREQFRQNRPDRKKAAAASGAKREPQDTATDAPPSAGAHPPAPTP